MISEVWLQHYHVPQRQSLIHQFDTQIEHNLIVVIMMCRMNYLNRWSNIKLVIWHNNNCIESIKFQCCIIFLIPNLYRKKKLWLKKERPNKLFFLGLLNDRNASGCNAWFDTPTDTSELRSFCFGSDGDRVGICLTIRFRQYFQIKRK